jgi:hypothetical protein
MTYSIQAIDLTKHLIHSGFGFGLDLVIGLLKVLKVTDLQVIHWPE